MQTMRFAEGYNPPSRLRPDSLGLTVLMTGAVVSGLFFLNPKVARIIPGAIPTINIPLDPPKPQPTPKPQPQKPAAHEAQRIVVPPIDPVVKPFDPPPLDFTDKPPMTFPPAEGDARTAIEPTKPPVMVGPNIDPRYAGYFQPAYPPDEIRAGNAGRVTVKVLIGVDGRVKDIEKISAASDSFWDATRRQALSKWRFKPATRDGVPYETWKTMNVSFVLNQDQ